MKKLIARINEYLKKKKLEREKALRFAKIVQRSMCYYDGKFTKYDNIRYRFKPIEE